MNPDHTHTPAELKAKYPYMFPDQCLEFSFAHGWIDLFARLCADTDALLGEDKRRFRWLQVTEKFGYARFDWQLGKYQPPLRINLIGAGEIVTIEVPAVRRRKAPQVDEQLMRQITELVHIASRKTRETCIACGAAGCIDTTGGYMLVLCERHRQQRKDGSLANFWFEPLE